MFIKYWLSTVLTVKGDPEFKKYIVSYKELVIYF